MVSWCWTGLSDHIQGYCLTNGGNSNKREFPLNIVLWESVHKTALIMVRWVTNWSVQACFKSLNQQSWAQMCQYLIYEDARFMLSTCNTICAWNDRKKALPYYRGINCIIPNIFSMLPEWFVLLNLVVVHIRYVILDKDIVFEILIDYHQCINIILVFKWNVMGCFVW